MLNMTPNAQLTDGKSGPDVLDLNARAACLINPDSGIANDFLNHFNEILLLVENLPVLLPEMIDELLAWHPVTYVEYFRRSSLPGREPALRRYFELPDTTRIGFERLVDALNAKAVGIVSDIGKHRSPDGAIDPNDVAELCGIAAQDYRDALRVLTAFVNTGRFAPDVQDDR